MMFIRIRVFSFGVSFGLALTLVLNAVATYCFDGEINTGCSFCMMQASAL